LLARLAPAPTVVFGWSLGAGAAIVAGAGDRAPPNLIGVVAESPYRLAATPARNMLRTRGLPHAWNLPAALAWRGLSLGVGAGWQGFDRAAHAAALRVPLLVIHGEDDEISPVEDGHAIAARAARGRLVLAPGAGHYSLWTDSRHAPVCEGALREFAASLAGGAGDSGGHARISS
jgi:hypothetical protein